MRVSPNKLTALSKDTEKTGSNLNLAKSSLAELTGVGPFQYLSPARARTRRRSAIKTLCRSVSEPPQIIIPHTAYWNRQTHNKPSTTASRGPFWISCLSKILHSLAFQQHIQGTPSNWTSPKCTNDDKHNKQTFQKQGHMKHKDLEL